MVVVKIIFARPQQFHRHANFLGDRGGFQHVIVGQAPAESSADAANVNRDIALRHFQQLRHLRASAGWRLAGRPEFQFAVPVMRQAVLRLQRRMRDERVGIRGFDDLGGGLQRFVSVAIGADRKTRRLLGKFIGFLCEAGAALFRCRTFVPGDAQFFARGIRLPPGIGHHRDATMQPQQLLRPVHHEAVAHAGHGLDFVHVGRGDLSSEHRTFIKHRVQHAGNFSINAVNLFAADDFGIVHAANRFADNFVVFRILGLHGLRIGRRHRGNFGRELAIASRTVRSTMKHAARCRRALAGRDRPVLRRRGDKHLAHRGAGFAQGIPIRGSRRAASGALRTKLRFIQIGLFDADIFPVHIQLVGKNHRQMGFHALTDFGIFGHDGHDAVRRHSNERRRIKSRRRRRGRTGWRQRPSHGGRLEVTGDEDASTCDRTDFQKRATIQYSGWHAAPRGWRENPILTLGRFPGHLKLQSAKSRHTGQIRQEPGPQNALSHARSTWLATSGRCLWFGTCSRAM